MKQKTKTYFFIRLIAFIIDLSVIYGIAFILYNLIQLFHIYIPTVRLSLIIAFLYFPILTIIFKASTGKILCGLNVENNSPHKYSASLFLREVVYKQLFYILPIYGLTITLKLDWLSPYFEILCILILGLILFISFLFRRRTWYDKWANTTVVKNIDYDVIRAKKGILFLLGIALIVFGIRVSFYISGDTFNGPFVPKQSKRVTAPYVSFLEKQKDAKGYIFELFEKNDIVILCEREHPEMTQYDFIYDLVSDKRFIENVGNVFSEVGSRSQQPDLDSLMNTDSLPDDEFESKLGRILQNYSYFPIWGNTNYYNYFKNLYALNQHLPKVKRIQHNFTEIGCKWEEIKNKNDYSKVKSDELIRDKLLADKVISKYESMSASGQSRKKCLVIMNYRHAFIPAKTSGISGTDYIHLGDSSCASYIMRRYPDKTANVLINTVKLGPGLSNPGELLFLPVQKAPVDEGIWDNSFAATGNKSFGFNFKNSPFGEDEFDLFFLPSGKLFKYQDVFKGFVFYKPLEEHYNSFGFRNIIANGFDEEILKRAALIDDNSDPDADIKYVKEKVKMLRKQDITLDYHPYRVYRSVFELVFGTMILISGLILGFSFFLMKRKISLT